jgi:serine/threonine protein phosphatase 1
MPEQWLEQGGAQTVKSYQGFEMPPGHIRFLSEAKFYFIDQNRVFVHGGFDPQRPVTETLKEILLWDRNLLKQAQELNETHPDHKFGNYDEIYIGHTPTINFKKTEPQKFCNVWTMDTGAGWGAKLTIMDIDTKQFWQF